MMTLTFLSGILFTGAFRCKKENKPRLLPHPTPWNLVLKKKIECTLPEDASTHVSSFLTKCF